MSEINSLDPDWVAALSMIKHLTDSLDIPFMVIGASARDILLSAASISPVRATRDVDLAIEIASWISFEALKEALLNTEHFSQDREVHRIIFQGHLPIDIIPYGAIETNSEISWPPDHVVLMSVAGMKDVFNSSLRLPLSESSKSLEVNVASSTGIVLLKLLAWESRKTSTTKDAEDLYFLIRHYIDLGNQEHLKTNHADLFDDIDMAHSRLLGRDLRKVCGPESLQAVKNILDREISNPTGSQLARHMFPASSGSDQQLLCEKWLLAIKMEMFN